MLTLLFDGVAYGMLLFVLAVGLAGAAAFGAAATFFGASTGWESVTILMTFFLVTFSSPKISIVLP